MKLHYKLFIAFILLVYFIFFVLNTFDEPEFKSVLRGHVIRCYQVPPRYVYSGSIHCSAKLENSHIIDFGEGKLLNQGDEVRFFQVQRKYSKLITYERAN